MSSKFNSLTQISIACTTYSVHNNRMRRTSAVQREILVRILSGYCSFAYRTGSPTRSEFTRIRSDWNQLTYCLHSKAHNFAQESPIEKIKIPFRSPINVLSDGVLISVSTKCGEWVVYPERVTYRSGTFFLYSCKAAIWIQETSPRLSDVECSVVLRSVFAIGSTLASCCFSGNVPLLHTSRYVIPHDSVLPGLSLR